MWQRSNHVVVLYAATVDNWVDVTATVDKATPNKITLGSIVVEFVELEELPMDRLTDDGWKTYFWNLMCPFAWSLRRHRVNQHHNFCGNGNSNSWLGCNFCVFLVWLLNKFRLCLFVVQAKPGEVQKLIDAIALNVPDSLDTMHRIYHSPKTWTTQVAWITREQHTERSHPPNYKRSTTVAFGVLHE